MSNEIMDSPITQEELDVMMAGIAVGQLFAIDCEAEMIGICKNINVEVGQYMDMLVKASEEGITGNKPSKMKDVISKIIAETFPAVLKLSNSIN